MYDLVYILMLGLHAIPPSCSSLPPLHFTNYANLALLTPTEDGSGGGDNGRSILKRVRKAKMLVHEDDTPTIKRLAARAKVVRADLKARAHARSKLSSLSAPTPPTQVGWGNNGETAAIAAIPAERGCLDGV
jgi:hypothetical protein